MMAIRSIPRSIKDQNRSVQSGAYNIFKKKIRQNAKVIMSRINTAKPNFSVFNSFLFLADLSFTLNRLVFF